jgi:hypothetical protein
MTLRPEADRLVEQLWPQKKNPDEIAETLRADRTLSAPLRHAALRALLERTRPAEAAPASTVLPDALAPACSAVDTAAGFYNDLEKLLSGQADDKSRRALREAYFQ